MYTDGNLTWTHAPVTLVPSPYPRRSFEYVLEIQPLINTMIDNIARDRDFLTRCLQPVARSDPFVSRLLELFHSVPEKTVRHGINLGILRSDYMLNDADADSDGSAGSSGTAAAASGSAGQAAAVEVPLQIEINTIASSFGCLSQRVGELHRHVLTHGAESPELAAVLAAAGLSSIAADPASAALTLAPANPTIATLAQALALAQLVGSADRRAVVLFIIQPGERNQADQRLLEAALWERHGVRAEFVTLAEAGARARVAEDGSLWLLQPPAPAPEAGTAETETGAGAGAEGLTEAGAVPVAVVYYRAGYTPSDYPSEQDWAARALLERSAAIKCPSVGYQLAGTKRVQQELCLPGVVERYVGGSLAGAARVRRCFAAQYSLGDSAGSASGAGAGSSSGSISASASASGSASSSGSGSGSSSGSGSAGAGAGAGSFGAAEAVAAAEKDGNPWVLKPQREGGGNNYYGPALSSFLAANKHSPVLSAFVLMQRIFPQPRPAAFVRGGVLQVLPSVSELGVYGVFLGDGGAGAGAGEEGGDDGGAEGSSTSTTSSSSSSSSTRSSSSSSSRSSSSSSSSSSRGSQTAINAAAGYLLRTKPLGVDEGGVATGFSVLGSLLLAD